MTTKKPTRREAALDRMLEQSRQDVKDADATIVAMGYGMMAAAVCHFFDLLAADHAIRSANATVSWAKGNIRAQSETIKQQALELDREKAAHLAADRAYSELACRTVSDAMYERLANRFEVAQVDAAVNAARVADLERQLAVERAEVGALRDRLRTLTPSSDAKLEQLVEQLRAVDADMASVSEDVVIIAKVVGQLTGRLDALEAKRAKAKAKREERQRQHEAAAPAREAARLDHKARYLRRLDASWLLTAIRDRNRDTCGSLTGDVVTSDDLTWVEQASGKPIAQEWRGTSLDDLVRISEGRA